MALSPSSSIYDESLDESTAAPGHLSPRLSLLADDSGGGGSSAEACEFRVARGRVAAPLAAHAGGHPVRWRFAQAFGEKGADGVLVAPVQEADMISAVRFGEGGDMVATGDKGGRIVVLKRTGDREMEDMLRERGVLKGGHGTAACDAGRDDRDGKGHAEGGPDDAVRLSNGATGAEEEFAMDSNRGQAAMMRGSGSGDGALGRASFGAPPNFTFWTQFQSHEPEFDYLKSMEIEEKINQIRWCRKINGGNRLIATNDKTIKIWSVFEKEVTAVTTLVSPRVAASRARARGKGRGRGSGGLGADSAADGRIHMTGSSENGSGLSTMGQVSPAASSSAYNSGAVSSSPRSSDISDSSSSNNDYSKNLHSTSDHDMHRNHDNISNQSSPSNTSDVNGRIDGDKSHPHHVDRSADSASAVTATPSMSLSASSSTVSSAITATAATTTAESLLSSAAASAHLLPLPLLERRGFIIQATPRRVFSNAHAYHINSISLNSDEETFLSADDLRVNMWNLNIGGDGFNILDIKPENMEELTEVITAAQFHPQHCHLFMHSSSRGVVKLCDLRQSALCQTWSKEYAATEDDAGSKNSFFSEIIASISSVQFSPDGRFLLTRDFMNLRLWDLNMERTPVLVVPVHEHLRTRLADLYENDCIFDKFQCAFSHDGGSMLTGSYNSLFQSYSSLDGDGAAVEATVDFISGVSGRHNLTPAELTASHLSSTTPTELVDPTRRILHLDASRESQIAAVAAGPALYLYYGDEGVRGVGSGALQ